MKVFNVGISIGILLSTIGCNNSRPKSSEENKKEKANINELYEPTLVPTTDGGAYAYSFVGPIWYLKNGKAVIVRLENGISTDSIDPIILDDDPVPSLDGGAYINASNFGLGYLKKDTLYKVREVNKIIGDSVSNIPIGKKLNLLLSYEISRHLNKKENEEIENPNDGEHEDENEENR
jgi:hypothetical protein